MSIYVCVCARACVRACVRAYVRACVHYVCRSMRFKTLSAIVWFPCHLDTSFYCVLSQLPDIYLLTFFTYLFSLNISCHWRLLTRLLISVHRFLETGLRSDFTKVRMKLSEMASLQLQDLLRKSRQLRDTIQQDAIKEDCVYLSEFDNHSLFAYLGSPRDPYGDYGRRIEVVTLD